MKVSHNSGRPIPGRRQQLGWLVCVELVSAGRPPGGALAAVPVAEAVSAVVVVASAAAMAAAAVRGGGGLARAYHWRGAGRGLVTRRCGQRGVFTGVLILMSVGKYLRAHSLGPERW